MGRKKKTLPATPTEGQITATTENLPPFANMYQSVQRDRVGLERALETRGHFDPEAARILEQLRALEAETVKYLSSRCAHAPVWPWLQSIKGIGERIGGMLIGLIDIHKADTVSALWRYAGFSTVCAACRREAERLAKEGTQDRETFAHLFNVALGPSPTPDAPGVCPNCGGTESVSEQRRAGDKLHFNMRLKKTCFLVARSFLLNNTEPYVTVYREKKAYYTARRPTWPKGRVDLAARRVMVKVFLAHLFLRWREAEGLSVGVPYAYAVLKHDPAGYIPPPGSSSGPIQGLGDIKRA